MSFHVHNGLLPSMLIISSYYSSQGSQRDHLTHKELDNIVVEQIKSKLRANTAPTKGHRKNWNAASVDIKTHRGEKVKVKAPGMQ